MIRLRRLLSLLALIVMVASREGMPTITARPPGFNPEKILVMKVALSGPAYREAPKQMAYFREALDRLRQLPGVAAAGTVYSPVRGIVDCHVQGFSSGASFAALAVPAAPVAGLCDG